MSDQYARRTMQAVLGLTVNYALYPVVGAGVLNGATVTTGVGVWGADKELIAAAAIAAEYWAIALDFDTANGAQLFTIDAEIAGVTSIFSARIDITAVTVNQGRMGVPYPRYIPAGSQITARGSGTAAKTLNVSILVATGL